MIKFRKKILIDLDGVLNEYSKEKFNETYIPEIKSGAREFVQKLNEEFDLYLFTSRNLLLASKWLINNDLDKYFKEVTNIKIPAYLYIDDRAMCFDGNYQNTFAKIQKFSVYWK
ncbi:hypothetical protein IJG14_07695 [bacterium]|nr:hypothetical protein [bacterium]